MAYYTTLHVHQYLYVLLLTNSILNPLIYMSYIRLKLGQCFKLIKQKVFKQYSAVRAAEERRDIPTSNTQATMRSSIQVSGIGNITSLEPLYGGNDY